MKKDFNWNIDTIGYWSALGGVEVKDVIFDEDIDPVCYCISGAWTNNIAKHRIKVRYSDKGPYIILYNLKLYFEDCIGV